MSLVAEYKKSIRERMLGDAQPAPAAAPAPAAPADMGGMDEETLNSMLELIQREIAKREAVGEPEGMEDPAAKSVVPQDAPAAGGAAPAPGAGPAAPAQVPGAQNTQAAQLADDIYFEMLSKFKENIAQCPDESRKSMYSKCYEHLYKMREKFIKEMTAVEEPMAPSQPK